MSSKAEREWMGRVAELPCCVCGDWPVSVHHAMTGGGGRRDHKLVLPLCHNHHQGEMGLHTLGRKVWQAEFGSERELLADVFERLGESLEEYEAAKKI